MHKNDKAPSILRIKVSTYLTDFAEPVFTNATMNFDEATYAEILRDYRVSTPDGLLGQKIQCLTKLPYPHNLPGQPKNVQGEHKGFVKIS